MAQSPRITPATPSVVDSVLVTTPGGSGNILASLWLLVIGLFYFFRSTASRDVVSYMIRAHIRHTPFVFLFLLAGLHGCVLIPSERPCETAIRVSN